VAEIQLPGTGVQLKRRFNMSEKEYWAYKDKDGDFHFIYPSESLVKMCSPDFFDSAIKDGEGNIVKVRLVEVEDGESSIPSRIPDQPAEKPATGELYQVNGLARQEIHVKVLADSKEEAAKKAMGIFEEHGNMLIAGSHESLWIGPEETEFDEEVEVIKALNGPTIYWAEPEWVSVPEV
jgi:hypothetical protein